jgi:hypothetical protein
MMRIPCEIVRVQNASFLVNGAKQACRYERPQRRSLSPGYYLAWSRKWRYARRYDEHVRYFGPLPTVDIARFLEMSARALGLIGTPATAKAEVRHQRSPVSPRRARSATWKE